MIRRILPQQRVLINQRFTNQHLVNSRKPCSRAPGALERLILLLFAPLLHPEDFGQHREQSGRPQHSHGRVSERENDFSYQTIQS
jgi:hypothetical protein